MKVLKLDVSRERTWRALGELADHPAVVAWREQARAARATYHRWTIAASLVLALASAIAYRAPELHEVAPQSARTEQTIMVAEGEVRTVSTARGMRRAVKLPDGSTITLNTASRVEIDYSGADRHVNLLEGEAMFDVAKNPQRPFVVAAAGRQVVALGTAFGVRLDGQAMQVTLVEGSVAIGEVQLEPGQQLIAAAMQPPVVRDVDIEQATSWRTGWLVLERETVRDAIREVARYTDEQIICDDPRLMELRVSGAFRIGEVEDFLDALAEIHPITVERPHRGELRLVLRGRSD
jgi:transmembrane sensor